MKQGKRVLLPLLCSFLLAGGVFAQGPGGKDDVFKGKLFAPNVILEHQEALQLDKTQFTAIRAAVVETQGAVAEHEWDMREAYMQAMSELDRTPVNESDVLQSIDAVLKAENEVKKLQVSLLIKLRNLLTAEQLAYLRSVQ